MTWYFSLGLGRKKRALNCVGYGGFGTLGYFVCQQTERLGIMLQPFAQLTRLFVHLDFCKPFVYFDTWMVLDLNSIEYSILKNSGLGLDLRLVTFKQLCYTIGYWQLFTLNNYLVFLFFNGCYLIEYSKNNSTENLLFDDKSINSEYQSTRNFITAMNLWIRMAQVEQTNNWGSFDDYKKESNSLRYKRAKMALKQRAYTCQISPALQSINLGNTVSNESENEVQNVNHIEQLQVSNNTTTKRTRRTQQTQPVTPLITIEKIFSKSAPKPRSRPKKN
ncbi:hypothetical protein BpHYR1_044217 [Brachionus plicatilis]|uniref:Uncharacterized protein n=1 Tax=Brachionus plicatilis TaxID=10195 RepID=A0A3M7RSI4_BRAPC|nr:hypothetical protein BpHYR1_044217 [Brachionus plicatilis]